MRSLIGAGVVVVGGSSGVGLAVAEAARDLGARLTIVGRDPERLESARVALGLGVRARVGDAADEVFVEELFAEVANAGSVDHVAVLAGMQPAQTLAEMSLEAFREAMEQRVWAAANVCRFAADRLAPGGSITFCSGVSSVRPRAGRSFGATATAALESFTRAMAVELAPTRVNVVCPGPVDSPMFDRVFGADKERMLAALAERLPLGRVAAPSEVADGLIFLMTNTYVTGTTLVVDGGSLLV